MQLFRPASQLMAQYAQYHRSRRNIATHLVGIPLIVLSIGVLLQGPTWVLGGLPLTLAWFFWGLTSLWYLSRGNVLLGLATVLVNGVLIGLAHELPVWLSGWGWPVWQVGLGVFAVGCSCSSLAITLKAASPLLWTTFQACWSAPCLWWVRCSCGPGCCSACAWTLSARQGPPAECVGGAVVKKPGQPASQQLGRALGFRLCSVQHHAQLAPVARDHRHVRIFLQGGFAHQFDAAG